MALTPQQIQEMNKIASGGATAQPATYTTPAQSSGGFLADEAGDWGITSAAKSLTRNVLSAPVAFGKELVRPVGNLISKTNQLALDFSTKHLGADNPFTQGFADTQKTYDYIASQNPLDQGVLGKTSENFGGKVGGFAGQMAPYFMGKAETVGGRALLDTGISYAQTGDIGTAATTGLVSAATGLFGPVAQGASKLFRGGKAKPVTDLITKTDIAKKFLGSVGKGTGTGYVAGTTQNLAEGEGSEAFIPDAVSIVGGVIGGVSGIKPMRDAFKVRHLQQTEQNMDKLTSLITQGKIKDIEKTKAIIKNLTPDEIKSIKTYQDYEKVLNNKISNIEEISDKALETNKATKKLADLSISKEVNTVNGVEKVANNYIEKGLSQLDDYYTHINDVEKAAQIKAYIKKANTVGLNARDINDISKIHGQDLNAFNANNELSNGLAKTTAENTRKGMKDTVYEMFGNKELLKQKNSMVGELSNTRDLAKAYSEKVNKFEQSMQELGFGSRMMNGVKNIVYGLKFMAVKTIAGLSPTVSQKMTPVEIQKNLNNILTDLNSVLKSDKTEDQILKSIDEIARRNNIKNILNTNTEDFKAQMESARNQVGNNKGSRLLPAGTPKFPKMDTSGFDKKGTEALTNQIQKTSEKNQIAVNKFNQKKEQKLLKKKNREYQPYTNPEDLPTIKAGTKLKKKDNLPVIRYDAGKISPKALIAGAGAVGAGMLLDKGMKAAEAKVLPKEEQKKSTPLLKTTPKVTVDEFPQPADANKRKSGFIHSENRGAFAQGKDLYKEIGVTGDIGKYQANPQTIKEWSKAWLGKTYTPEQFKNSPEAQEKFIKEFLAVTENYKLTPEESAIVWHKGWGKLGDGKSKAEKTKLLREHIERQKKDENVIKYVNNFKIGYNK